jgi:hypothetical protein
MFAGQERLVQERVAEQEAKVMPLQMADDPPVDSLVEGGPWAKPAILEGLVRSSGTRGLR